MVVVDNARRMISKNIDVVVTSVLQTTAGKMIFGRYIEGPGAQAPTTAVGHVTVPPSPGPPSGVVSAAGRAQPNGK
jgi:hypothetical protein